MARVMNDTNRIAGLVAWNMVDMLWAFAYVVGVFVAMALLNWKLALIVMLIVPAIAHTDRGIFPEQNIEMES